MMSDQQITPRPPIATGGKLAALVPQSLDDAYRLATALARSGDMVPKHFQGSPDMIMAALVRGAEIGLLPMQALSNIAVINGRASLWGDALPALMQRAGHQLDTVIEGEGDSMVATTTLRRGDTGQVIVRSFSAADAKAAGLWNKQGPWQSYKPRMLSMRSRSWACRDGAADALMGLQIAEEMQDAPPIRDVTPKENPLAQFVKQQRAVPVEDHRQEEDRQQTAAQHWTDGIDWSGAFPGSAAWDQGAEAFTSGKPSTDCPYEGDTDVARAMAADWLGGWHGARRAAE